MTVTSRRVVRVTLVTAFEPHGGLRCGVDEAEDVRMCGEFGDGFGGQRRLDGAEEDDGQGGLVGYDAEVGQAFVAYAAPQAKD